MPHTKGPWKLWRARDGWNVKTRMGPIDCGLIRVLLPEKGDDTDMEQTEANARLIAAAPDLLAALQSIIDLTPDDDGDRIIPPGFLDEARAAIAKATAK